jgi:hypothetical protein
VAGLSVAREVLRGEVTSKTGVVMRGVEGGVGSISLAVFE